MKTEFIGKMNSMQEEFRLLVQAKDADIAALNAKVESLETKVLKLEEKVDDTDAYERRDTVVLSGDALPVAQPNENCSRIVCEQIRQNLHINLSPNDVSVCHRLGSTSSGGSRTMIVKFCRRDLKREVLKGGRTVRPNGFYVNEHLTPRRSSILFALRKMKKDTETRVKGCATIEGKVFVWVQTAPNATSTTRDTKIAVNTYAKLQEICSSFTSKPLNSYIGEWKH